ncbi:M56 family metallopeptidase [Fontibacillus sp. BL9]|uniref:M56 family metallopeptidase n=1 Tax=Fontibacillus sp. BL9 TaxID=3389971 RepID=UPI00397CF3B1
MDDLLRMSLSAALMIAVVVIIRALCIHRLPKKTFLVLWGIVIYQLLIPYSLSSRFSIYSWIDLLVSGGRTNTYQLVPSPMVFPENALEHGTPVSEAEPFITWSPMLLVWLAGVALGASFFSIAYLKCRREFRSSLPVENEFVSRWLSEHRLMRSIRIRQSDKIKSPLTYGIFRPVILMPNSTDWNNDQQLPYVLMHEFVHIRRLDAITKLLLNTVLCIHWFNPLVWVMYMLANRDIELSCDETVVRSFGQTSKRAYAMALISMEERKSKLNPLGNHFSKHAIEERIVAIMKMKKFSTAAALLATSLIICTATVFATAAEKPADPQLSPVSSSNANAIEGNGAYTPVYSEEEERAEMKRILTPYEKFGLIYDTKTGVATFNGKKVRDFFDEQAEIGFSLENGEVDLSATYAKGKLSGLRQATPSQFEARTKEKEEIQSTVMELAEGGAAENNQIQGADQAQAENMANASSITTQVIISTGSEKEEGKISLDGGLTWLTQTEYEAKYPASKVEWWTYDDYKDWLEQEKKELSTIIGSRGWNPTDGWYTWTQEKVDEAVAMYEGILEDIKNGVKVSKSVDGDPAIMLYQGTANLE